MVKYTISMTTLDMEETLRPSLTSILDQITSDYEVMVVDGGSTDGSISILEELSSEYANFRFEALRYDPKRRLGRDRQISIEKSKGDYILVQMDTDDYYEPYIQDFVTLYNEIERNKSDRLFIKGCGIGMANADLLQEIGYRNVGRREDRDLWRRHFENKSIIWLDHKPFYRSIGYDESSFNLDPYITDFQVGIMFRSYLSWTVNCGRSSIPRQVPKLILAYLLSKRRVSFNTPEAYKQKGTLAKKIIEERRTIREVEEDFDIYIDKTKFSNSAKRIFWTNDKGYNKGAIDTELIQKGHIV